ncbi:MAG: putative nucleotidyltransferase substrate binding domain-containing protein [bacterium]|nr:putative nucleotidyltransferase substrate binding domain-containing protein [bacterium]
MAAKERANPLQDSGVLYRIAAFQYHESLRHFMVGDVYTCRPDTLVQAVAQEMAKRRISSAVVVDQAENLAGIVTERDIVKKVVARGCPSLNGMVISKIMTPNPFRLSPEDRLFDALALFARHTIKHLPIVDGEQVVGILTFRQILKIRYSEPLVILGELEKAESAADYRRIRKNLVQLVKEKLASNVDPVDIVFMLSMINADIHTRLLRQTLEELGESPPVDFALFVTGSHGRRENLLFPDQDFCIITEDYDERYVESFDRFFLKMSQRFSDLLNEAGFVYCSGNVMGQNPLWRKRISPWREQVTHFFQETGPYTVRYMTLIFDSAPLFGNRSLFDAYQDHAFKVLSQHHNVIRQMHAEEEAIHKVPLGFFGSFITEKEGDHEGEIDMKKSGLIFIIEAARILALKHGIRQTSTMERLMALVEQGVIQRDDSEYFENAYRVILYQTLKAQVDNYLMRGSNDYYLDPSELSARHQELLKQSFKAIARLQELVASEFGELIL